MSSEPRQPSEEELRAAYEAEIKRLRVDDILLDNVAALANLGMRRTGLAPGTESERDPDQVRLAIESIRALMPVLEQAAPSQIGAIRDAVSQLQIAFVRIGGQAPEAGGSSPAQAGGGSPAQAGGDSPAQAAGGSPAQAGGGSPTQTGEAEAGAGTDPAGSAPPAPEPPKPGEAGPAQRSGRLWVPRQ